jgi:magnesium and cobalt transporter
MTDAVNGESTRGWLERILDAFTSRPQNQKQLVDLLKNLQTHDQIGADELFMIEGVLQVSDMQVRDIMIPRGQMIVLEHSNSFAQIIEIITESGHSRFPVIDDDKDDVVGILLAKDLLQRSADNTDPFEFNDYIRPASFIPESKRLNVLLKDFRQNRSHIAMVVDEYGGVSGLVTIEDVLEQIVGKMHHGQNRYTVRALTPLQDFNDYFKTEFTNDEIETIGGYLLGHIGHLPERGESLALENLTFKVLSADSRHVHLYQVIDDSKQNPV